MTRRPPKRPTKPKVPEVKPDLVYRVRNRTTGEFMERGRIFKRRGDATNALPSHTQTASPWHPDNVEIVPFELIPYDPLRGVVPEMPQFESTAAEADMTTNPNPTDNTLPDGWKWRTWDTVANRYLGGTFPDMDKCRRQARAVAKQMRLSEYKERFQLHLLDAAGEIHSTHGWEAEEPDFSSLLAG